MSADEVKADTRALVAWLRGLYTNNHVRRAAVEAAAAIERLERANAELLHERGELVIENGLLRARVAELTEQNAALRHGLSLIELDTAPWKTDCSTPAFQMVRNALAELARLRPAAEALAALEELLRKTRPRYTDLAYGAAGFHVIPGSDVSLGQLGDTLTAAIVAALEKARKAT